MNKPTLLILAAGIGSRYGGNKQIEGFGPREETIMEYSIFDAIRAGFGRVVFIVREEILDMVKDIFVPKLEGKIALDFVIQSINSQLPSAFQNPERFKPFGTGHAVLCAKETIKEPFAVINADDFYGREAFDELGRFLTSQVQPDYYCMVGYALKNVLSENGTVSRGVCETDSDNKLVGMAERTSISREGGKIISRGEGKILEIAPETPVSMNCWGFHPSFFVETEKQWKVFLKKNQSNLKSEFYIPMVVNSLIQDKNASVEILEGGKIWFGVTYPEDKPTVISYLKKLHKSGVYPEILWE